MANRRPRGRYSKLVKPARPAMQSAPRLVGVCQLGVLCGGVIAFVAMIAVGEDPGTVRNSTSEASAPHASSLFDAQRSKANYLGTKRCRMCHTAQHKSLLHSAKKSSWGVLKPGVAVEIKTESGLDPTVDYSTNAECLPCHSVGFGHEGGYVVPDPQDARSIRRAAQREGVGCESCHGPGSRFVNVMADIDDTGRMYKPRELHTAGLRRMDAQICAQCHNERATCILPRDAEPGSARHRAAFEVDFKDRRGYHAKFPLTHRSPAGRRSSSGRTQTDR